MVVLASLLDHELKKIMINQIKFWCFKLRFLFFILKRWVFNFHVTTFGCFLRSSTFPWSRSFAIVSRGPLANVIRIMLNVIQSLIIITRIQAFLFNSFECTQFYQQFIIMLEQYVSYTIVPWQFWHMFVQYLLNFEFSFSKERIFLNIQHYIFFHKFLLFEKKILKISTFLIII